MQYLMFYVYSLIIFIVLLCLIWILIRHPITNPKMFVDTIFWLKIDILLECGFIIPILIGISNEIRNIMDLSRINITISLFFKQNSYCLECGNLSQVIKTNSFSFENFSFLVVCISTFLIFCYFFGVTMNKPIPSLIREKDGSFNKYFWFIGSIAMISAVFVLLSITNKESIYGIVSDPTNIKNLENYFSIIGLLNIITAFIVLQIRQEILNKEKFLDDFNLITSNNDTEKDSKGLFEKIVYFLRCDIVHISWFNFFIFSIMLTIPIYAYVLNFSIFSLIFIESVFLLLHMVVCTIFYTPAHKSNIHLDNGCPIENVYILFDVKDDFIVILTNNNKTRKIRYSSIKKIEDID